MQIISSIHIIIIAKENKSLHSTDNGAVFFFYTVTEISRKALQSRW